MTIGILLCFIPSFARAADVAISLPLAGYYRPGRYMPIRWIVHQNADRADLTFRADGAIPTVLHFPDGEGISPFLPVRTPVTNVGWHLGQHSGRDFGSPLRALNDDDALVGLAAPDKPLADALFPGNNVIAIPLDPSRPLPGAATAWQSLDAVIFTPSSLATLADAQRAELLAGGTTLAVSGDAKPDARWPWQSVHGGWALRATSAPPVPIVSEAAYAPTYAWRPGRSGLFRRNVLLAAVLVSIALLAVALAKPRWAVIGVAMLSAASAVGAACWGSRQSPVAQVGGDVQLLAPPVTIDRWTYEKSSRVWHGRMAWQPQLRPLLWSPLQIDQAKLVLEASTDGPAAFTYDLLPDRPMAFVSRSVAAHESSPTPSPTNPLTSPLRLLVRPIYPGWNVLGEGRAGKSDESDWPAIILSPSLR